MRTTVVVPVLDEQKTIGRTLSALEDLGPEEVIVVDGGSTDGTIAVVEEFARSEAFSPSRERSEARVRAGGRERSNSVSPERSALNVVLLSSARGRARQMNEGAGAATGDVLLFLHADTRLPPSALDDVRDALADPQCVGGRFDVELKGDHWMLKWIGAMISLRSRLSRVATGDQAMFVRKTVFDRLGGFPEIPLMEDVALSRMLKREGAIACLRSRVVTSARRWERDGVWSTIWKMWWLKLLYFAGVSPRALKRYYVETR